MDAFVEQYFWVFFVAIMIYGAYSLFTKHGKGRIFFGGEIVKTFNRQITKKSGITTTKLKVHLIKPRKRPRERDIGIELSTSALLGWSMMPITLTATEASQLRDLIEEGLSQRSPGT